VNEEIRRAARILRAGGLVAFPTETVYGLGADASSAAAVAKLYAAKRRPAEHPVIVHFDEASRAFEWAREVPEAARLVAQRYWPGPLTLVLRRSSLAQDFVTGGQDSIGLRVPSHRVAQALLREFGAGVAAPSANMFSRPSATSAAHVRQDLAAHAALVLDGGASEIGIESTILDFSSGRPVLLRPGHISAPELETLLGRRIEAKGESAPRHSGGLERHYEPRTPSRLVPTHALDAEIARHGEKVAVLAFSRPDERVDFWIRMPREPAGYAKRLYAALRELDSAGCETILIEQPPQGSEWDAVLDRLQRATG
jgi:L-threonylcarbamoyladenylate synthase